MEENVYIQIRAAQMVPWICNILKKKCFWDLKQGFAYSFKQRGIVRPFEGGGGLKAHSIHCNKL
jgi:hypothetical protein